MGRHHASSVGSALTSFAVILQIYDLTRSPLAVGAVGVAQMVPTLTVGLAGGAVTDATDRRKLVLVTSSCLAAVSAALAAQAFAGLQPGLAAVRPGRRAVLAQCHRPPGAQHVRAQPAAAGQLAAGLALNRLSFQITLTAGPALGRPYRGRAAPGPAGLLPG